MSFDLGFRRRRTRKERKREQLRINRNKGKAAETMVALKYTLQGYEVEPTGRGSDLRIRKRDWVTGRVKESKLVEIKSGDARLSKLQRKTKKKKSNYKVERVDSNFL